MTMHNLMAPPNALFGINNGYQNVSFNFGGNPIGMSPLAFPNQGNGQHLLPNNESPMLLEARVVDSLLEGESLFISEDCKIVYGNKPVYYEVERTFEIGGTEDIYPIDDDSSYFVDAIDHHKEDPDSAKDLFNGDHRAFIFNRGEKMNKEPVLIIIDPKSIDKVSIDHYLYHTIFLARKYKYTNFFLIIEESGSLEDGDPEPCYMNINRCRVNVYYRKVEITNPPEDWINYQHHRANGQEYSEVSRDKLDMDRA